MSTLRLSQIDSFARSTSTGADHGPYGERACTMYVWRGGGGSRADEAVLPASISRSTDVAVLFSFVRRFVEEQLASSPGGWRSVM